MKHRLKYLISGALILIAGLFCQEKYDGINIIVDKEIEVIWNPTLLMDGEYYSSIRMKSADDQFQYLQMHPQKSFDIPKDSKFLLLNTNQADSKVIYIVRGQSNFNLNPGDTVKAIVPKGIQYNYLPSTSLTEADSTVINMVMRLVEVMSKMTEEEIK